MLFDERFSLLSDREGSLGDGGVGVLHLLHKHLGGLESGDAVLGDDDGGVLGDVAGGLFRAYFDDEAAKSSEVDVLAVGEGVFDYLHEFLDRVENIGFVDACRLGNLVYNVGFSLFGLKLF